jgi:hypothetical protein
MRMLFKELKVFLLMAPILWCDNLSALALASNLVFHARTKHIEVDYHFIQEKVLNCDVLLKFISTIDQVADIFTKGLSLARFLFLKSKLMVLSPPINLRGNVNMRLVGDSAYVANAAYDSKAKAIKVKEVREGQAVKRSSPSFLHSSASK